MTDIERWIYAILSLVGVAAIVYGCNFIAQYPDSWDRAARRLRRLKWRIEDTSSGSNNIAVGSEGVRSDEAETPNQKQREGPRPAVARGARIFRLARGFHLEECSHARGLTAEELVKRTFIGVDAATFRKLRRLDSWYEGFDCENWHSRFNSRLEEPPACRELAAAAESLGFFVEKVRVRGDEHFKFLGVRPTRWSFWDVKAQCGEIIFEGDHPRFRFCECRCAPCKDPVGGGGDTRRCPCDGCYCQNGCASGHADINDRGDPLISLSVPDANEHYRSRRFKLAQGWHTDDCKFNRSFTAEELARMMVNPKMMPEPGYVTESKAGLEFNRLEFDQFDEPPGIVDLVDAFLRLGQPVYRNYEGEYSAPINYYGSSDRLRGAWWYPYSFSDAVLNDGRWICGDKRCYCECLSCNVYPNSVGDLRDAESGCADCACWCEGCFCPGTCATGHAQPEIEPCEAHFVEREGRGVPSFKELSTRGGRRFELEVGNWHAPDCRNARHLTVEQLVDLTIHPRDTHKLGR